MPIWEKAEFKRKHNSIAKVSDNDDEVVIIPLSQPNTQEIDGFLACNINVNNTNVNEFDKYNRSIQYFENGKYNMAFITVQEIISDPWIFNTLSRTDKNKVETFSKTCNDSVSALIKRSLTNISYLNNLNTKSSINYI